MAPKRNRSEINDIFQSSAQLQQSVELVKANTGSDFKITLIPLDEIDFNSKNEVFRKYDKPEDIISLAESIEKPEELRNAILVSKFKDEKGNTRYRLIAGERRTRAFIYNRDKERKNNLSNASTKWDKIPARVYENIQTQYEIVNLYLDNLQGRNLSTEQIFAAFYALISYLEVEQEKSLSADTKKYIADKLHKSVKTVERMKKLQYNASRQDVDLLNAGKITFEEFKKRTNAIIRARKEQEDLFNSEIYKRAVPKNYLNTHGDGVYYVDVDKENSGEKTLYCVHYINQNIKSSLHLPELPNSYLREAVQAKLDEYASNNRLSVYNGNFSEYNSSVTPSIDMEQPTDEAKETTNQSVRETNTFPETDSDTDAKETSEYADSNTHAESDDFSAETKDDNSDESSDNPKNHSKIETEGKPEVDSTEKSIPENRIKGEIAHFEGVSLSSGTVTQGSLYCSPTSDRIYIISNISFGANIGTGKFEARVIAEEVHPDSVRLIKDF